MKALKHFGKFNKTILVIGLKLNVYGLLEFENNSLQKNLYVDGA